MTVAEESEQRLRELAGRIYRCDPDRFVEERDRVAREVRDEGDRELAEAVGRLRKPTLPAWAVDQLALRDDDELERLFRLGDEARGALGDAGRPVREAMADVRRLVTDLRGRAGGYLEEIGAARDAHLDEIERTLMTAAVDPGTRADVGAGMLTRPLEGSGFGSIAGLEISAAPGGEGGRDEESGRRHRLEKERRRLEGRIRRARERADEAQSRADSLRRRADEAQEVADRRAAELSELEEQLSELQEDLDRS